MTNQETNQEDLLKVTVFDPNSENRGESPKKAYYEKFTDIGDEIDEPTLFELMAINARKVLKRFKDSEPKEVTEMGCALALLDENKKPIPDGESGKLLAVEHVINRPKPASYEFFQNTGLYKFFKELKFTITEEMYKKPMDFAKAIGLRMRLMVEIKEGVGKKSGKAWRAATVKSIQAPKDKEDIDNNNLKFKEIFED